MHADISEYSKENYSNILIFQYENQNYSDNMPYHRHSRTSVGQREDIHQPGSDHAHCNAENIKMVDISTTKIIGNQCTDNIVRIKPYLENDSISSEGYSENELLGTLTIIGERHIAQYDILYTESPQYASTIYNVSYNETQSYIN